MKADHVLSWQGLERGSTEECRITEYESHREIDARVVLGTAIFQYRITTDKEWRTVNFTIGYVDGPGTSQTYSHQMDGSWTTSGNRVPELDGCIDIDILFTPFTNSLPINRLQLQTGQSAEIKVVYIDTEENRIYPATQRYTRISSFQYRFETVPEDFKAVITVDENGFVTDYPELFTRMG